MRLIILAILIYLAYRLLRGFKRSKQEIQRTPDGGVIDEMVQDPVCKTYVPRREAVRKVVDGREVFFCSEACASRFEKEKEG